MTVKHAKYTSLAICPASEGHLINLHEGFTPLAIPSCCLTGCRRLSLGYLQAVAVGMEPLTCHWSHIKGSGKYEPRDNSSHEAYRPEGLWHTYARLCRIMVLYARTCHC